MTAELEIPEKTGKVFKKQSRTKDNRVNFIFSRPAVLSYFAGGSKTPSITCTIPLEAGIDAITCASFINTFPSLM